MFAPFPSAVPDVTFAVLVIVEPGGAFARNTIVNEAVDPAGSVAIVHETVPAAPTAGAEQLNAGPLVCVTDWNVVLGGVVSVIATDEAFAGPLFVIETTYVRSPVELTVAGPLFVTPTSAVTATVLVVVEVLFAVFDSGLVVEIVAVLLMTVPFGVPALTLTTIWITPLVPGARNAFVQVTVPVAPTAGVAQAKVGPDG